MIEWNPMSLLQYGNDAGNFTFDVVVWGLLWTTGVT